MRGGVGFKGGFWVFLGVFWVFWGVFGVFFEVRKVGVQRFFLRERYILDHTSTSTPKVVFIRKTPKSRLYRG